MLVEEKLVHVKASTPEWYQKFESLMVEHNFQKTQADHYIFVKGYDRGDLLILLLYVDDILNVGQDTKNIGNWKALSKSFVMKDIGLTKQILGMHIVQDRTKRLSWLSQEKYVTKVL